MQYLWSHIATITERYQGEVPLAIFLKNFFRQHPKLGSRDRKMLSEMAYAWYRVSKALDATLDFQTRVQACLFLTERTTAHANRLLPSHWPPQPEDIAARISTLEHLGFGVKMHRLLPFAGAFSTGITPESWFHSLLQQPRLFLRIRKDKNGISQQLAQAGITPDWLAADCLALPNGTDVASLLSEETYVVQDASSQRVVDFYPQRNGLWWDCCSGAGGKSLLVADKRPGVQLHATDIRDRILHNLKERFRRYRLPVPQVAVVNSADAQALQQHWGNKRFDVILCDVPCSGSGTWARTPESLYFFTEKALQEYAARQQQILRNAAAFLKPDGQLLYVTCSVFRQENEDVVATLMQAQPWASLQSGLINGIAQKADCLYAHLLTRAS